MAIAASLGDMGCRGIWGGVGEGKSEPKAMMKGGERGKRKLVPAFKLQFDQNRHLIV